jgi:hypothetical protein
MKSVREALQRDYRRQRQRLSAMVAEQVRALDQAIRPLRHS